MKLISLFFIITLANAGFGQNLPDTIIVLDNDTFKVYRGITSKEVKLKSELSINQYIVHAFPEHVWKYISDRKASGKFHFKFLVDVQGLTHVIGVINSIDPYLEEEFYKIFKTMTWEPALDLDGTPVNRMIVIPILLNSSEGRKHKKKKKN